MMGEGARGFFVSGPWPHSQTLSPNPHKEYGRRTDGPPSQDYVGWAMPTMNFSPKTEN